MEGRTEKKKKRIVKHAKDPRCFEESEEYNLNRYPQKAATEGRVYYRQRAGGRIVKTEVTLEQWKELYNYNKKCYRCNLDYYDEDYFSRMPEFYDDDGEEDDPMEHFSDFESRFCESDNVERMDREKLLSKLTKLGKTLYRLYYQKQMRQDEIAGRLHVKQYRVSRWLQELDEAIGKELLDDGERSETDIEVEYRYSRYRKTGRLECFEDVTFEDFLSNLQPWEENRLRRWFYSEKELYRYGIRFLIRFRLEESGEINVYREVFKLKDLQVRGYFMSEMEELPTVYQRLFLCLEKEIERRAERFSEPRARGHEAFIEELTEISKNAGTSPEEYFETRFLPFYRERTAKKRLEFAAKELGFFVVKEGDRRPIPEQIESAIAKLPAKERKCWQNLAAK